MWLLRMAGITFGVFVAVVVAEIVFASFTQTNQKATGLAAVTAVLHANAVFFSMVAAWFFIFRLVLPVVLPRLLSAAVHHKMQ